MAHLGTIKRKTQSVQSSRNLFILSSHRENQAAANLNHASETLRFGAQVETHFRKDDKNQPRGWRGLNENQVPRGGWGQVG